MRKRILYALSTLLFAAALLVAIPFFTAYSDTPITVTVDGQTITFPDQGPVIVGNRTLVPVRGVFEEMGFTVEWADASRMARLTNDDFTIIIPADSTSFLVNGEVVTPDVPQRVINNRLMLPLRAIAEAVDATAEWNARERNAVIMSATPAPTPSPAPAVNIADMLWRQFDEVRHYFGIVEHWRQWYEGAITRREYVFETADESVAVRTASSLSTGTHFIDAIAVTYWPYTPDVHRPKIDFHFNAINRSTTRNDIIAMFGPGDTWSGTGLVCGLGPNHLFYWGAFASDEPVMAFDFDENGRIITVMIGNLFDPPTQAVAPILWNTSGHWEYHSPSDTRLLRMVYPDGTFFMITSFHVFSGHVDVTDFAGTSGFFYLTLTITESTASNYYNFGERLIYVYDQANDRLGRWVNPDVIAWYVRVDLPE